MVFLDIQIAKLNIIKMYDILDKIESIDDLKSFDDLKLEFIDDDTINYLYKNIGGKIKLNEVKPYLYTLFDIYNKKHQLVKFAYHYKKNNFKKQLESKAKAVEFSRSGNEFRGCG